MLAKFVSFELLERDGWTPHDVPREIAKEIIRDMLRQMADESFQWLCLGLTLHQLDELAHSVKSETLERERARNLAQTEKVHLLGEL